MAEANFVDKTIWTGDNLDILRGLNSESVDLIYLDPPFNSNRNYAAPVGSRAAGAAFKDTWTLSDLDTAWMGLIADEQPAMYKVIEAAGLTHGKGMQSYLCMMAVRLVEMRRVLKDTGSIYLHCDPTASHYLKMLMDSIFGSGSSKNDIIWQRTGAHNDASRYGSIADYLLFYAKTDEWTWNAQYTPYSDAYIRERYHYIEEGTGRRFWPNQMTDAGQGPPREIGGEIREPPNGRHWAYTQEDIYRHEKEGRIYWSKNGRPYIKNYLDERKGRPLQNIWTDVVMTKSGSERIGYPTQKPLALLERIISASSNPGDVVLDPFCGCATACVAAEKLGRKWVGIDISEKAVELVNMRLHEFMGGLFHSRLVTARTDIPRRTDIDAPIPYRKQKHVLFGRQEGKCTGCKIAFLYPNLTIDHVVPRSRGGTDHLENLQLLCGACNSIKGDREMAYLMARLKEREG